VTVAYLDYLMPVWRHRHRHRVRARALAPPVLPAITMVTWKDVPLFRMLTAQRQDGSVLDTLASRGFTLLHQADDEVVFGAAVRVWPPVGPAALGASPAEAWLAFDAPGHYKVAFNFRLAGGELRTETRVLATDAATARRFRRYWWLIRVPSALIRREWLRAARRYSRPSRAARRPA
jgi:hypothetical protein